MLAELLLNAIPLLSHCLVSSENGSVIQHSDEYEFGHLSVLLYLSSRNVNML